MHSMELQPLIRGLTDLEISSCLITEKGTALLEYYDEPQAAAELSKINSCTKSVLAALISIAIDQYVVPPPHTPILEFFPQLGQDSDLRKRQITLAHLLTMSSGFNWTEFGGQNSFPTMTKTADWVQFVLSQPLADLPGTRMVYNSGNSQLLSAILRQATGQSVAEFAEERLFQPLGITDYRWDTDPQGIHTGGFGLYLKPQDMSTFGQLYLQQGRWEGEQLIASATVQHSTSPLIEVNPPHTGFYGWHWWISSFSSGIEHQDEVVYHYARGFGGQFIIVVPSSELVCVITKNKHRKKSAPVDVFRQYIVPHFLYQGGRYDEQILE